jgi:hypothetical protein
MVTTAGPGVAARTRTATASAIAEARVMRYLPAPQIRGRGAT